MIGTLARKRMQFGAMLALVAMLGALFAVFPSANAAPAVGDVNSNSGTCLLVPGTSGAATAYGLHFDNDADANTQETAVTVLVEDRGDPVAQEETAADPPNDSNEDLDEVPLTTALCEGVEDTSTSTDNGGDTDEFPDAPANLNRNFKITPNGTATPIIEILSPSATITVADSDGIVKAGGADVKITIKLKNMPDGTLDQTPRLHWIRASGELDGSSFGRGYQFAGEMGFVNSTENQPGMLGSATEYSFHIAVPDGTTEGEYTVSARISYGIDDDNANKLDDQAEIAANNDLDADDIGDTDTGNTYLTPSAKITVGDPGTNLASATLSLSASVDDNPLTTADETKAEDGVEPASNGDIWLSVASLNSLGEKANGGGLDSITVIAPGGDVSIHLPTAAGTPDRARVAGALNASGDYVALSEASGTNSARVTWASVVNSTMYVKVSKTDKKPGTVNVFAQLTGDDGAAQTETLELVFTGAGATLALGDSPNVAPKSDTNTGLTEFTVGALDSGGNDAAVGTLSFSVTDADGKAVSQSNVKVTKSTVGSSTPDKDSDDAAHLTAGLVEIGSKATPGDYTIEAKIVGVDDSEATTTVTVVGAAGDVSVESSASSSDAIGDVITVTATVNDEDGNAVADGTAVDFDVSTSTGLAGIGKGHGADDTIPTKGGVASVKYAVVGSGTSVISASAGGATGVVVVISTAGTAAAADEAVSLDCLSATNGFATYTCGTDSSASELFGLVSGRGATAVHLWNGSDWVRYSVVDGAMVPGSSDFTVTDNDILYISN